MKCHIIPAINLGACVAEIAAPFTNMDLAPVEFILRVRLAVAVLVVENFTYTLAPVTSLKFAKSAVLSAASAAVAHVTKLGAFQIGAAVVPLPTNSYPAVPPAVGAYILVLLVYACELFIVGNP